MDTPSWGASPEAWRHFAQRLGLTEDLLPVVSNPHAKIAELSKLKDLGKTPSRYNNAGQVVGIPSWTAQLTTEKQVKLWSSQGDLGICVQTRNVRAIDIDIEHVDRAREVMEMFQFALGPLPVRRRPGTGKCLLALRVAGSLTKRVLRTEHGAIEFLASGQQFVAVGTHVKSRERYEWVDADGVLGLPDVIPKVTQAEFDMVWSVVERALGAESLVARRSGLVPTRPRVASDAWGDPMVPWLEQNDWVREFDRDGRVHIRCPWEHEHTTDSGPSATTYFPAGVGGYEQGHFRCLHAHCAARGDREFLDALGIGVASDFEPIGPLPDPEVGLPGAAAVTPIEGIGSPGVGERMALAPPTFDDAGAWPTLQRNKAGRILPTADNAIAVMLRPDICGARICYDEFKALVMVAFEGDKVWRPLRDTDYTVIRATLERRGFEKLGKELVRDGIMVAAEHFRIDSAIDWAQRLRWDGVPRVATFFSRYMGAEDRPYVRAVAMYLWTALAARCLDPGHKVDMVPVLISKQGTGKTSMVEALAPEPEAFVEINLQTDEDKLARMLRGKLVAEIAELRGINGRDAESIKAWISRRYEEWVPKYVEHATRFARRMVLIGTHNKDEFLDDETGERRWLPLRVGKADLGALRADVEQLWAEAVELFDAGGLQWQQAEALALEEHAAFKVHDEWEELIAEWLNADGMDGQDGPRRGDQPVSLKAVLAGAIGLNAREITRQTELRAGKALRKLGFEKIFAWDGTKNARRWVRVSHPSKG